jgi:hypothetical protein
MNIVSSMVGLSIMGAAAPGVITMSIAPFEAQKRAQNLGIAETAAVTYAAANEFTAVQLTEVPTGVGLECDAESTDDAELSWTIKCRAGVNTQYEKVVTRAFRVMPLANQPPANGGDDQTGDNADSGRTFDFVMPGEFSGHACTSSDPWGVNGWWNSTYPTLAACVPKELRTKKAYLDSHPDDWSYDARDYGWGDHPLY